MLMGRNREEQQAHTSETGFLFVGFAAEEILSLLEQLCSAACSSSGYCFENT